MNRLKNRWLSNGLAMFSMFFGAGNVIFPLIVGFAVRGSVGYALLGLLITAVIVPFSGLLSITLFEGNYVAFFNRMGKSVGALATIAILSVLGPFGAIPRCIALTYSTFSVYFSSLHLGFFILASSVVILFFCLKKNRVLEVLGYVLTPLLLLLLLIIIAKGLLMGNWDMEETIAPSQAFFYGLKEGYFTMDLLAAFFFSSVICERLKSSEEGGIGHKSLINHLLKASSVGAGLLALVYIGFATVASLYSDQLAHIPEDHLLGGIGKIILGPAAGLVVGLSVALSCLTTAIALTLVCAEFLEKQLKSPYTLNLFIIIGLTAVVSLLEFSGIKALMTPILIVCYPALLMLSLLNLLYKAFHFKPVKTPVFIVFILVLLQTLSSSFS